MKQVFKISSLISFLLLISSSILAQVDTKDVIDPYSKIKQRYPTYGYINSDSTVFDLRDFRAHKDRTPNFYQYNSGDNYFSFRDDLKTLLEYETSFKIEQIKIKTAVPRRILSGYSKKEYRTRYRIYLDEYGNVSKTKNISNTHEFIDTLALTTFLKNTVWRPGLKNMTPVKSVFILEIKFDSSICKYEYLADTKKSLNNNLKYQIEEVQSVYYDKEMIWDEKLWTLVQNVTSDSEMENIITKVKSDLDSHLNQMEQEYLLSTKNKELSCREMSQLISEMKNKKEDYVNELLRMELTKLSKNK